MKIENALEGYKTVILGYSGGVDSQVLLNLLKKMKNINIVAMHVNHNINEKSEEWEDFCKSQESNYNVKVKSKSINLTDSGNLENEARKERYSFFKEEYDKYESGEVALVTGHHLNDQAETVIFKLMRGSGLDGLSGIKESSSMYGMTVVRPLLGYKKSQILEYAKLENLSWVEDPSNKSLEYDRNFIRNEIIPLLETRWDKAVNAIGKSAKIIAESNDFEKEVVKKMYKVTKEGWLDAREINKLDPLVQKKVVRDWIKEETEMSPDGNLVESVVNQCVRNKPHNSGKVMKKFFRIEKNNHMIKILNT